MSEFLGWTPDEVVSQLQTLGMGEYQSAFIRNDISGAVLPLLQESHLKELGINKVGHRLKLIKYIMTLPTGGRNSSHAVRRQPSPRQETPAYEPVEAPTPAPAPAPKKRQVDSDDSSNPPSSANSSASAWEKKRRQMLLNRQNQGNKQAPADDAPSQNSGRLLSPELTEKPPASKPAAKPTRRPAPKQAPVEDDDDDGYTPPPPPKKAAVRSSVNRRPPSQPAPQPDDPNDDRVACPYCGRKFASDRISKHEEVCARMSSKKTKVFDAKKQRLAGTEAIQYQRAGGREPQMKKDPEKYKREHQKLVEALRAARKYQAYEKAKEEGKAVGPPPDLPKYEIEDDDRVPCPYCGRKFAAESAQRHIGVCERMNAGKRGPPPKRGGRGGRR